MSGIDDHVRVGWAKVRLIGPSSRSLLSSSTHASMTVIKRSRGGREGRRRSKGEKMKKGRRKKTVNQLYGGETYLYTCKVMSPQLLGSHRPQRL